jgi:capsular exopolysaccharide synthesis family protein
MEQEYRYDAAADWLEPPTEEQGLRRYVETIRERLPLVLLAVAVTTAFAVAYVVTAPKTYEAEADILVTPIPGDDPTLLGLGLIVESPDPTRDVETASRLITTNEVAERAGEQLGLDEDSSDIVQRIEAAPVSQSNIVVVTAKGETAKEATDLADAVAEQAIAVRTESFQGRLSDRVEQLQAAASTDPTLSTTLATLESLREAPTPDMSVETLAETPSKPASPRPVLSIVGGLLAGLVLGIAGAFATQALDPRLRREEQLRRLYRLPILARIPRESTRSGLPIGPRQLSAATAEAYRTLRATLAPRAQAANQGGQSGGRVILVTGSSASEGKTTTAVNLASSLALAGKRVIIIEADLRRPSLGDALGLQEIRGGVVGVLIENMNLADALTPTPSYGANLQVLAADYEGGWIAELFTIPAAQRMIADARQLADYVVIDSPPLNEVVDALPLAQQADDTLLVVRLGKTRLDKVSELGELLAESGVRPVGFAVVGTSRPTRGEYHYYRYSDAQEPDGAGASREVPSERIG